MQSKRRLILFVTAFTVVLGFLIKAAPLLAASKENILYSFKGYSPPRTDGANPEGNLIFDAAGNLYGATVGGGTYGCGTVFELTPGANGKWTKTVLHDFGTGGCWPEGGLIFDGGGNLYGTTAYGGDTYGGSACHGEGCGTVFELTPGTNGQWTKRVLHNFGKGSDGVQPSGGLALDAAGNLYGFTTGGGALGGGTAFQLTPGANGRWTEKLLYGFSGGVDWQAPSGTPVFDAAGNIYGTTIYENTAFRLVRATNGNWEEEVLHNFGGGSDGSEPVGGVILDSAGNIYGVTWEGGANGLGTVFKLAPTRSGLGGWAETVLLSFSGKDGRAPEAGLVLDGAGNLYGTTQWGGAYGSECGNSYGCGVVFQLTPTGNSWTETVLHSFGKGSDGNAPLSGLIFDGAGNLYGATVEGGVTNWGIVFQLTPGTNGKWTEKVLHSFGHGTDGADGAVPFAGLIPDGSGNLYGTTTEGGDPTGCGGGGNCGTVFKLARDKSGRWIENQLHVFHGKDGGIPYGNLIFDTAGNLYGTTTLGGAFYPCGGLYCSGTVFKLAADGKGGWTETVLHSFGSGSEGREPLRGLVFDADGNLYGTTYGGGTYGGGTVFELTPGANGMWTETVLYNFCAAQDCTDGGNPVAGLIFDTAGNLYGTTTEGGAYGTGDVFQLTPGGNGQWTETVLYDFNGIVASSGVISDTAGNLYGTTIGISGDGGGVFELTQGGDGQWTETGLYGFSGGSDGGGPEGGLIFDAAGNLYGTTAEGGNLGCNTPYGCGVVFKLMPSANSQWTETVLHSFDGKDGYAPEAPLVLDPAGNLYGTTGWGGAPYGNSNECAEYGCGTVFEITP